MQNRQDNTAYELRRKAATAALEATRLIDDLTGNPADEVIVEGLVPPYMLNEWGEALPGFEWLDSDDAFALLEAHG